jgi:hypothetical protein
MFDVRCSMLALDSRPSTLDSCPHQFLFLAVWREAWQFIPHMIHRFSVSVALVFALIGALCAGCGKSDAPSTPAAKPASPSTIHHPPSTNPAPILRLHWLGKKRLAIENNATNFMALWNLPESSTLEVQTLDKLATAPWRLWATNVSLSNAPSAQLRPLLADLVQEESYLEVMASTNQPLELVFALRLPADRAALWQTNLSAVLLSLFPGAQHSALGSGFRLQTSDFRLDLNLSNDWTLLSLTRSQPAARHPQPSRLLATFQRRLAENQTPFVPRATNYWVEANFDLLTISKAFELPLPAFGLERLSLNLLGDGANVRTHGDLFFSQPLPIELNAWNMPSNLISDQLISFTAVRGVIEPLAACLVGQDSLKNDLVPEQAFLWALPSFPMQSYLAVPTVEGSNHLRSISQWLLQEGNDWLRTNSVGSFVQASNYNGIFWQGMPFATPFLRLVSGGQGEYLLSGLASAPLTNRQPRVELTERLFQHSDLILYDWELSAPRLESWFYVGQLGRIVAGKPQLKPGCSSILWLKAIQPKLYAAGTTARLSTGSSISIDRSATVGLSAIELHLLADWLESLDFPLGLHTTTAPAPPKLGPKVPAAALK